MKKLNKVKFPLYENIGIEAYVRTIEKYGNPELIMRLPNESDEEYRERLLKNHKVRKNNEVRR